MKKKTIAGILCLCVFMSACGNSSSAKIDGTTITATMEAVKEIAEAATTEAPYANMLVTTEQALSNNGFYLKQSGTDGALIDISGPSRDYDLFYCPTYYLTTGQTYNTAALIQKRSFEIPALADGDELLAYNDQAIPDIVLREVEDSFYTLGIFLNRDTIVAGIQKFIDIDSLDFAKESMLYYSGYAFIDSGDYVEYPKDLNYNGDHAYMDDMVNGFVPFEKDEKVTLSWYNGTQYNEREKDAVYKCYCMGDSISVEYALRKDGFVEYDVSTVPAGLYAISSSLSYYPYGLIEIL